MKKIFNLQTFFLNKKIISNSIITVIFFVYPFSSIYAQCVNSLDYFNTATYNNQDGELNWTSNWVESGDDGSPTSGKILINSTATHLDMKANTTNSCSTISRSVDLSSYVDAILTLNYLFTSSTPSNKVEINISADGGGTFTKLGTITPSSPNADILWYDITSYMSSNTVLELKVCGFAAVNEVFSFDFVDIFACTEPVFANDCSDAVLDWVNNTNGKTWPVNSQTNTYSINHPNGILTVNANIIDPFNRNSDSDSHNAGSHPFDPAGGCYDYIGGGAVDDISGDGSINDPFDSDCGRISTQTMGAYGPGFLTYVIYSADHTEEVTMQYCFDSPVLLTSFKISDIDYSGLLYSFNNFAPEESPGNSYQDEVTVLATDVSGNDVPLNIVAGSAITMNGQTAAANYNTNANGDLSPNDANGMITVSSTMAITCLKIIYSNGPDDAADEQNNPSYYAWWSNTHGATNGVSDDQAIRISKMNFCVCNPFTINVNNDVVCAGEAGTIAITSISGGIPPYYYLWPDSSTTATFTDTPTDSTQYPVAVITDIIGCTDTAQGNIAVIMPPVLTNITADINCATNNLNLASLAIPDSNNVTGSITYYLTQADAINKTNAIDSTITTANTYWVRKETVEGCYDVTNIEVSKSCCLTPTCLPVSVTRK